MQPDLLERHIPRLLDELADEHVPDYYHDLFSQTARTRQRPAWTLRERWLPMLEIARQPVVAQPPWRALGLLLLLVGVLLAGLVLAATRPKPPPLFGPAGNGLVVMSRDGDILTYDPRTGVSAAIVTGPEIDSDPMWSQDGSKLLFRRASTDRPGADFLMLARANGTRIKALTPEPMTGLVNARDWHAYSLALRYSFSPDGRSIVLVPTIGNLPTLLVVDTDTGTIITPHTDTIPMNAWFSPSSKDILYVGSQGLDGSYAGLYLIGADGTNPRTIIETGLDAQIWSKAFWSPDGTRVAYARFEPGREESADGRGSTALRKANRVHVITVDGKIDRIVRHKDGAWWEAPNGWSPDGRWLLIERSTVADAVDAPFEAAILDVDGPATDLVPKFTSAYDWWSAWSPDGTKILATPLDADYNGLQQQLWDTQTGHATTAPWTATSFPSWQRVGLP